jgi:preprotein translocase subunit YajC
MGNSPYSTLVLIALMVVAFYFLIIRPNKKRQQAQQQTMRSLTAGTRVLLTSGVFGTIVEMGEKQAVIELSPGVHLTVLKQAIARAVKAGDEDTEWESADDDDFDEITDTAPAAPVAYGADPVAGGTTGVEAGSPWSADSASYPTSSTTPTSTSPSGSGTSGTDQDPRSGTNTTPIKD